MVRQHHQLNGHEFEQTAAAAVAKSHQAAQQAPLSLGFSRQEYWSELPLPSPGQLTSRSEKKKTYSLPGNQESQAVEETNPTVIVEFPELTAPGTSVNGGWSWGLW